MKLKSKLIPPNRFALASLDCSARRIAAEMMDPYPLRMPRLILGRRIDAAYLRLALEAMLFPKAPVTCG